MAEAATLPTTKQSVPPYIPWKTYVNFAARWKASTTPHKIDGSTMNGMAGGMQRQLKSALRFLGHIDAFGVVQPSFNAVVKAHGTDQWPSALKEHVLPAYEEVIFGLPIDNASSTQLSEAFREKGHAEGQVVGKAVRFWLQLMTEAKVPFSPFFKVRKENAGTRGSVRKKSGDNGQASKRTGQVKPVCEVSSQTTTPTVDSGFKTPDGTISFPLRFKNKKDGLIFVPDDLNQTDFKVLELTVQLIQAYASPDETAK